MPHAQQHIYWNSHKKCYSVRFKGRVVAHLDTFALSNVTFKVNGIIVGDEYQGESLPDRISCTEARYNPLVCSGFYNPQGRIIVSAHANFGYVRNGKPIIWVHGPVYRYGFNGVPDLVPFDKFEAAGIKL